MAIRRYTFRLYPNKTQERELFAARRLHCYLFNACIAHRRFEWKNNQKTVDYFQQQNCLPAFKKEWIEFVYLHSQALQSTVKRVDLAYNSFLKGLRGLPKFKAIRNYSGWTYSSKSGWKAKTEGLHGSVTLNDLGITLKMRGQAKSWGIPTTLTIVYKPSKKQWFASFTCNVSTAECSVPRTGRCGTWSGNPTVSTLRMHSRSLRTAKDSMFGSSSDLEYESIVAFDLGTATAITCFDGKEFEEISNPRFAQVAEKRIKKLSLALRRKRKPDKKKKIKASSRWKKARHKISQQQRKVANQRRDWQHRVTSEIASRYDIGVTEKLNTRSMTRKAKKGSKRKRQKAGLNKSILSVGFGTLNQMIAYKIEAKGGLVLTLNTLKIKPSQRCPQCGTVHKEWADLSNRYHICDGKNGCGFEVPRDRGSVRVMYNVACNKQKGLGTSLSSVDVFSSTSSVGKRKHTGSMKQLGQMKRQKSQQNDAKLETPTSASAKLG